MKNYYDELEISKNASKEVIDKVYKVLAKKYHPDTTQEPDKHASEEKFKIINEAYEILSNDEKRKKYDLELKQYNQTISYEQYQNIVQEKTALNNELNNLKNKQHQYMNSNQTSYTNNQSYYTSPNRNFQNKSYTTNSINNTSTSNSKQKKYYYTNTGKPASAFAYYKYKIKNFLSNLILILLAIIALILAISSYTGFNIFELFI